MKKFYFENINSLKSKKLFITVSLIIISLILLALIISLILPNEQVDIMANNHKATSNVIVIDPGHGGVDPGAVGSVALEKDINLEIALKLDTLLRQGGWQPVLLRNDDRGLYEENSSTSLNE